MKTFKKLKLIVIIICILTMIMCLNKSSPEPIFDRLDSQLWDIVWEKNATKRIFLLNIEPHIGAKTLNVTYDGNVINCKNLWHYKEEKSHRWILENDYKKWEKLGYILYWDKFGSVEYWGGTYFVDIFNTEAIEIESDAEFETKICVGNFFQKPSDTVLDIILQDDLKHITFEVDDNGILITSESDLSDSGVELRIQNLRRMVEYELHTEDDNAIYSMYIQMISETECKVFLDLDNDGEFEYECVGKEREW